MIFLWVIAYGLVNSVVVRISAGVKYTECLLAAALVLYDLCFVLWIYHAKQHKAIGLGPVFRWSAKNVLCLLPLAIFPVYNLVTGERSWNGAAFMLQMLCVALTEEIFFRGYLLTYLRKWGDIPGILLCSGCFSLLHMVNLLSGNDWLYVGMQTISAFWVSICYCAAVLCCGSLVPSVAAHFLVNVTGNGSVEQMEMPGLWMCIVLHALCGIWCCIRIRHSEK